MLNPDFVRDLRLQIRQSPHLQEFHGFPIQRAAVTLTPTESLQRLVVSEARLRQLRTPSRVFGSPTDPSCMDGIRVSDQRVPAKELYVVPRATVVGNNFILGEGGQAFSPSPALSGSDLVALLEVNRRNHQGFAVEEIDGRPMAYFCGRGSGELLGRALFLHNLEPANYGSFLFRQLPQMLLMRGLALSFDCYIVPERTAWLREVLQIVGLPPKPIYTVREVSGELFTSIALFNEFDSEGFFSEDVTTELQGLARTVWAAPDTAAKRVYISRRLGTLSRPDYRPLVNEQAVENAFRRRGFSVIHPETMSFAEQVSVFRHVNAIAGPSGSGMLNAIFSRQNTKILDMESFHYTVRQHAKIYSSSDLDYAFLFGHVDQDPRRPLYLRPWTADLGHVDEAIDWLLH